ERRRRGHQASDDEHDAHSGEKSDGESVHHSCAPSGLATKNRSGAMNRLIRDSHQRPTPQVAATSSRTSCPAGCEYASRYERFSTTSPNTVAAVTAAITRTAVRSR